MRGALRQTIFPHSTIALHDPARHPAQRFGGITERGATFHPLPMRGMGYDKTTITTHGWRVTARTILDEGLGFPMHVIEHQLDHAVKDANGRAYNRASHLPQRRKMTQAWADYLDALRTAPGKVVPIKRRAG